MVKRAFIRLNEFYNKYYYRKRDLQGSLESLGLLSSRSKAPEFF